MDASANEGLELHLRQGFLHVPGEAHRRYLGECAVVAFLWSDPWIECIPLHNAAVGGFLLKMRTPAGDRVVDLRGFLREHDLDDMTNRLLSFSRDDRHAAWRALWIKAESLEAGS